jgi:hypothetical protein
MDLILLSIGLPYFIKNLKALINAKTWDKFIFSLGAVIIPYSSIDALKYIFTGKYLFEKGDNTTINKTSKNQTK